MDNKAKKQPEKKSSETGGFIVRVLVIFTVLAAIDWLAAFFHFEKEWEQVENVAKLLAAGIVLLLFLAKIVLLGNRNKR